MPVDNDPDDVLLQEGNRDSYWPKVQPYLIALLTAKGTPLLSEGQEFCENYWIPGSGYGRVMLYRPVRWNFFNDYDNFNSKGLLAFSRQLGSAFSLVVVNFTNQQQMASFAFSVGGSYV